MKTTRRSILSLIFGAAAAPAAVAVAKAMPAEPARDFWGAAAKSPVGTVMRMRLASDYQVFARTPLIASPSSILPGRVTYLRNYYDFPIDAVRIRNQ